MRLAQLAAQAPYFTRRLRTVTRRVAVVLTETAPRICAEYAPPVGESLIEFRLARPSARRAVNGYHGRGGCVIYLTERPVDRWTFPVLAGRFGRFRLRSCVPFSGLSHESFCVAHIP